MWTSLVLRVSSTSAFDILDAAGVPNCYPSSDQPLVAGTNVIIPSFLDAVA